MRSRPLAVILLAFVLPVAACQLIWSYDGFKDQPGAGGSGGGGSTHSATSTGSTSEGSTSESSTSGSTCFTSGSSSSSGGGDAGSDAGCPNGAPTGMACMGCCDQMLLPADRCTLQDDVYACTVPHLGDQNGTQACMLKHGFSPACADCLAGLGQCGYAKCWPQCFNMVDSAGCNACLAAHCDADFETCSGMRRPEAIDAGADASCK